MDNDYDIVILIDCWDQHSFDVAYCNDFYKRLVNKLSSLNFENVVYATYPNNNMPTDQYIVDNIQSANAGRNLNCVHAYNIPEVTGSFDLSGKFWPYPRILMCGLSWQACVHWRSLGCVAWVEQGMVVHSHEDLVWQQGDKHMPRDQFFNDRILRWEQSHNRDDMLYTKKMKYRIDQARPCIFSAQ